MFVMGVDIGSTTSKAVIMDDNKAMISKSLVPVGTGTRGPNEVFQSVLREANLDQEQISHIAVTGYGRTHFEKSDRVVSEVSCHAKGIHYLLPEVRTLIDIGGQDVKAIKLDSDGRLENFLMNDKCAAGTGRFLDVMARVLDLNVDDLGRISATAQTAVAISSTCAVFAESEVISRLASNEKLENIVAGIHRSVAKKVVNLALRIGISPEVALSGGVSKNQGVVKALEDELNMPIRTHQDGQLAGAIGAALFALDDIKNTDTK